MPRQFATLIIGLHADKVSALSWWCSVGGVHSRALQVVAVAYDNPIPGYATPTTSNLRLWDAEPVTEFDLEAFNAGDYDKV